MKNCIFCKIVEGEAPARVVYEDESVMAFLDINPASEGHTLVITKRHYEDVYDVPKRELKRIIAVIKELAMVYRKALNVRAVNVIHSSGKAAQQDVFHFHVHLVPRRKNDGINLWYAEKKFAKKDFEIVLNKIKKHI